MGGGVDTPQRRKRRRCLLTVRARDLPAPLRRNGRATEDPSVAACELASIAGDPVDVADSDVDHAPMVDERAVVRTHIGKRTKGTPGGGGVGRGGGKPRLSPVSPSSALATCSASDA